MTHTLISWLKSIVCHHHYTEWRLARLDTHIDKMFHLIIIRRTCPKCGHKEDITQLIPKFDYFGEIGKYGEIGLTVVEALDRVDAFVAKINKDGHSDYI